MKRPRPDQLPARKPSAPPKSLVKVVEPPYDWKKETAATLDAAVGRTSE